MPWHNEEIIDGTGLKSSNAGEYRVFKYGDQDVNKKKLIGIEAHVEGVGYSEPEVAEEHITKASENWHKIKKFYGDGAYDNVQFIG